MATPKVFFVIGPAGSGKSSVGKLIARRHSAAYIDKDTATRRFVELLLELNGDDKNERDNNSFYQEAIMPLEYASILDLAGENLSAGNSVVLDAPFGRYFPDADYLDNVRREHSWPDAELIVVHVRVDGEALRQRLVSRGLSRDEWKLAHWEEFWAAQESRKCEWRNARHVTFDNTMDSADTARLDQALEELG
ncbi:AAA family ATPase [Arthrobacter sp. M4]|uniref:AAA family ATPase n=1 Tax=Arthrobacter sp. M4 TaxID=218160 RepID=UPI001CDC4A6B|nr:AAA family ATPase [Arthrobacter sp. M4]MCA4133030.1 ATP-binding protein [Arthrobacter sp. M4]